MKNTATVKNDDGNQFIVITQYANVIILRHHANSYSPANGYYREHLCNDASFDYLSSRCYDDLFVMYFE